MPDSITDLDEFLEEIRRSKLRGWIYSLAVEQTQRGRGIGRALLKRAEEALPSRGCLKVNLQVLVSNAHVSEFYQKSGYAVEERLSFGKLLY